MPPEERAEANYKRALLALPPNVLGRMKGAFPCHENESTSYLCKFAEICIFNEAIRIMMLIKPYKFFFFNILLLLSSFRLLTNTFVCD